MLCAPLDTPNEGENEEEDWCCRFAHCVEAEGDERQRKIR
jgi:hypothetical protein